jgi:CRISPR-associated endonuclease/helicase Cas3
MTATADSLRHVWAKSERGTQPAETLTQHTQQVLDRLAGWRRRYPELTRHTRRDDLWDFAAWACLLHDLGKSAKSFQQMLRGGLRCEHRHEALSLVAVGWLEVDEDTRAFVAAGVATHHKDLPDMRQRYPFGSADRDDLLAELSGDDEDAWRRWLGGEGAPSLAALGFSPLPALQCLPRETALTRAFRAVLELATRLEKIAATEPLAVAACAARGLVVLSDHAGSAHEQLATAEVFASADAFRRANAGRFTRGLEPHQAASGATDGHALLVAPTGSGKTEAALLWAARQHERADGEPTLFYVLPFKASLNAMRRRLPTYGLADDQVVLQHASATSALYRFFTDEKGYARGAAERAAKHERNLGRLMTAPVRVLTPYQLLRAFFGLRGHEAVLSDAAGGLFVLDELHAYEVERLALILVAVEHLAQRLGGRFFAMSATFPTVLRAALGEALGSAPATILATVDTFRRFQRHRLVLAADDLLSPAAVAQMIQRYEHGEAVLAVATTVKRAQRLFDMLERRLPACAAALLHSRFTAEDRDKKESILAKRVGTGRRAAGGAGTILVATQVVEVSLDVDFDVLFTDPAPLEALIQRFGRVNRALRGGLRDVIVCSGEGPPEGYGVYDGELLRRALESLRPLAGEAIDEARLGERVDAIYEPLAAAWTEDLRRRMRSARDDIVKTNRPLCSHPELERLFEQLFDGCEVVPEAKEAEFRDLEREDPLRAAFLRVPISDGQRWRLLRAGRLDGEIARVPYDEQRGLALSLPGDEA